MVFTVRATQQVERHEARDLAQMRVARCPDFLEIRLRPGDDFESIHRDKHELTYPVVHAQIGPTRRGEPRARAWAG